MSGWVFFYGEARVADSAREMDEAAEVRERREFEMPPAG